MRPPLAVLLAALTLLAACGGSGDDEEPGFPPGSVASPELPESCKTWMGGGVRAVVCDPDTRDGRGFSIATAGETSRGDPVFAVARILGQPLTDGGRVEFVLEGGSPGTVAALNAMDGDMPEQVVIAPFDPPARRYEVEVDGRVVRVTTDTGRERTIRIGEPSPDVAVRDGSPEETIRTFVELANHGEDGWEPACELLAESTREKYGSDGYPCWSILGMALTYTDNPSYPEHERTEVGAVSVDGETASVELTHLYRGRPREVHVEARVPLVEEDGRWRIVEPEQLSPIAALRDDVSG